MVVSNSSFGMCPKIIWVSWITWASVSKFRLCSSRFIQGNNKNLESLFQHSDLFFHFWFLFILHKILRHNIVQLKHSFSCLCGTTLSGSTHYFHVLISHVFFLITNEADTFPLSLPMLPNIERSSHFFVCFLHLSFSKWVCTTVFTKPIVTLWLYSIIKVIWTAITDKKYIESDAARWRQHLSDIQAIGIKLSVIVDTYTYLCHTNKKSPIL